MILRIPDKLHELNLTAVGDEFRNDIISVIKKRFVDIWPEEAQEEMAKLIDPELNGGLGSNSKKARKAWLGNIMTHLDDKVKVLDVI